MPAPNECQLQPVTGRTRLAFHPTRLTGCFWRIPNMGQTDETRLADARRREAEARKEYEAAVAAVEAHPGKRRGWRERQRRAAEAARALGKARAELDAAEADAGLREADAPAAAAGDCKLLVALVRVPARAADAMGYGPASPAEVVEEGVAMRYRMDFDLYADDPPDLSMRGEWIETVRKRFGATADDADAFRCVQVAAVAPDGDAARVIADALAREG